MDVAGTVLRLATALAVLVPSVVLHEVAHGAAALAFGDDTAKRAGRLTLDPRAHVDPFGSVVLPLLLTFTAGATFGYARPVPVNRARMRRPRDHGLMTSLAGPAANVGIALVAAVVVRWASPAGPAADLLVRLGVVNVVLAAFNLLPLPPLDGSAVVERLLPRRWLRGWSRLRGYAMPVVLLVVLLAPGALSRVFGVATRVWAGLALG